MHHAPLVNLRYLLFSMKPSTFADYGPWLIAGFGLIVFVPVLTFGLVNLDDNAHLERNPYFAEPRLENLGKLWEKPYKSLYIPFTYTIWSFASWDKISGPRLHALNLFLHLCSAAVLLYLLLYALFENKTAAFWGSLLFAIHPLQVEPVAWISGLKDVLSTFLVLAALLAYVSCHKNTHPPKARLLFSFSTFLFVLSVLAKPSTVVTPAIAAILVSCFLKADRRTVLKQMGLWLLIAIPIVLITVDAQANQNMQFKVPAWPQRFGVALDAIAFYLTQLVWPANMAVDYGRTPSSIFETGQVGMTNLLSGLFIACLFLVWKSKKARPIVILIGLWVFCLSPVLGLKPFVYQTTSTVADRYLYLPMLVLSILLAYGWTKIRRPELSQTLSTFMLFLFVLLGVRSNFQVLTWKNSISLFENNLRVNPTSWLSYNNLGSVYEKKKEYETALKYYQRSVDLFAHMPGFNSIAIVNMMLQRPDRSVQALLQAIRSGIEQPPIYINLSSAYLALGQKANSQKAFAHARRLNPRLPPHEQFYAREGE